MFLESDEEILHLMGGNLLLNLCSSSLVPNYQMNVGAIARAVSLSAIDLVVDACTNRDDIIMASHAEENDENDGGEIEPRWLAGNFVGDYENSTLGIRQSSAVRVVSLGDDEAELLIPIVRLHNSIPYSVSSALLDECNSSIFSEHVESLWPFLEKGVAMPFRGWVEFVVREMPASSATGGQEDEDADRDQNLFLCIRLVDNGRRISM
jgi:hypothetical protein